MTVERMERDGVEPVEVSSHEDSPSHRAWQGRCYSLSGERVVGGVRYPDLASSTGYGSMDGLLGANCRHGFGPYRHEAPRAYEPNPKHPSGLPGSEVYEYEQKQRHIERQIREAKRELRGAQIVHDRAPSLESRSALLKAQERLKGRQAAMRVLVDEANGKARPGTTVLHRKPNREWAGDMPKGTNLKASGRKLDEFLGGAGASASLKANGISKSAARRAVAEEMARRGGTAADFAALTAGEQQTIFRKIVSAETAAGAKAGGNVSSGLMTSKWLEQFDNEVITATLADGSIFSKEGTPAGVDLTADEVALLKGALLRHTHTTTIGGTFSSEDVILTVETKSPRHTVEATLFGTEYVLERTASSTSASASAFADAFEKYESAALFDARAQVWENEYEQAGIPLDDAGRRKADSMVKSAMHRWLVDNAMSYGFKYTFGKR